ncbi:MAG: UbiA family prenyltransferase [Cyclobacteriaceae bacterium]|nr:UbiA prenyltransferase family protein [Cyclobacteriaceae bacterium]MCH8515432.1 UbiA family prenyltransferase [Cyclobacteriaceae bacterium]
MVKLRSVFLHLRFPFSFFLAPVYFFTLAVVQEYEWSEALWVFLILHFLVYPASNGFNSYFDKDEGPIGGLEKPPKVNVALYYTSNVFDIIAILLSYLYVNQAFLLLLIVYILASRAYSHPLTRWKAKPILGWLIAGFFQGAFTFIMVAIGLGLTIHEAQHPAIVFGAILSSVLLWGSFPMTQIYQHEEDQKRGDLTMSIMLGKHNTFVFTAVCFLLANAGFIYFFINYFNLLSALLFQAALLPVLGFFVWWMFNSAKDESYINFKNTMRLNLLSSLVLNLYFILLIFLGY